MTPDQYSRRYLSNHELRARLGLPNRTLRARIWLRDRKSTLMLIAVVLGLLVLAGALGEGLQHTRNILVLR